MTDANLYSLLARGVDPDRIAVSIPGGRGWRYRDLDRTSARMAGLLAGLGAVDGERVVVHSPRSAEAICLYLACLRAGAVYVPVNPGATAAELEYVVADAAPGMLVVEPGRAAACPGAPQEFLTLSADGTGSLTERSRSLPAIYAPAKVTAGDVAAILYTSGTTGRSKGAMLTHGNLASNAQALSEAWRFGADDVLLHALPLSHVHGLFVALHCVLLAGARVTLLPRFDARQVALHLPGSTVYMGVPTHYSRLLGEQAFDRAACADMRLFVSGSAPLSASTFEAFETRTGHRILERYGMTETLMNTSNPYAGQRLPGSVGPALPGVELRVVDEHSAAVADAGEGLVEVRGPNVCKGYWRAPAKTAGAMREDGFFATGDIGRIDEQGYLWLAGRASDLIISGGYNVYPKEVEDVLDTVAGIVEAAVFGVPHPDLGEAVVAALRVDRAPDDAAIVAAVRDRLAGYKTPKRVIRVDEIPRNTMGKVQKKVLRETYRELFAGDGRSSAR